MISVIAEIKFSSEASSEKINKINVLLFT